jgi:hydroxyethylthiazole kinase-like uncharacterized protein yjeF
VWPVLTPAEMAERDKFTIAAGTPVEVLMERAGRAVAWAVRRWCGGTYGTRVLVVCGKGNNGGDGLVVARVLEGWGARVETFRLEDGVDRRAFERLLRRGAVVVDAMYGTGFKGALEGDAAWVARAVDGVPVFAIDIPSGVDGLTGAVPDEAVRADKTVTFGALKPGLLFEPGRSHSGEVEVVDIGIDLGVDRWSATQGAIEFDGWWPVPARAPDAHKWQSGVMVLGGSGGMTGAPLMVSRAALRSGAGIVWCCVPGDDAAQRASGGEVITKAMPATAAGALDEPAASEVLKHAERFRALVVGPGLGREEATAAAVRRVVAEAPVPLVLDADGLNCLAGDLGPIQARTDPTVLTPHTGEYERLAGEATVDDRLAAARRLAERSGAVVLLKGPGEVVSAPGGRAAINPLGGPWLASAGTGDVLSGIVGAFVGRGAAPFDAACAGAWAHSRAADEAGHTGLVAGDLITALPRALADLHGPETV